jgi:hypothetical protein
MAGRHRLQVLKPGNDRPRIRKAVALMIGAACIAYADLGLVILGVGA